MAHITDRFYNSKWGVFNHYLYHEQNRAGSPTNQNAGTTDWNVCADELDIVKIADSLQAAGANYYFFTVMQGTKYMAAPNSAFDKIAGCSAGEASCSRDIPLELAEELGKRGIDLYLYFTGDGPYKNEDTGVRFGFIEPRKNVSMDFVLKWASVLREYAVRYGDKVKGWWIDGCYRGAFGYTDELLKPYYDACKEGNPDCIVSLNDGVYEGKAVKNYIGEDFVCGEFNDFTYIPPSRFIEGSQAHILAPLGVSPDGSPWGGWCKPGVKRSKEYMADYIRRVNEAGGVVTVDVALYRDGSFDSGQLDVLKYVGAVLNK
ncbi:MAG: hypothetical protein ACYCWE_05220 [Eubacteriales bacterium]